MRLRTAPLAILLAAGLATPAAASAGLRVRAGGAVASLSTAPPYVHFAGGVDLTTSGAPSLTTGSRTVTASGTPVLSPDGNGATLRFPTGDPLVGTIALTVRPAGDGVLSLAVVPVGLAAESVSLSFAKAGARERFLGFGERSNAVDQAGGDVQDLVVDGPYPSDDQAAPRAIDPPWAFSPRPDASRYPVPWLLSTRGYGVLVDGAATSDFDLSPASRWSITNDAGTLALRVFAGPTPADALRRFTAATGRQPAPSAPLAYGPWFQTGQPNTVPLDVERAAAVAQRAVHVPVSVAETQMHYLPCGAQRGNEAYETARAAQFHSLGLSEFVYLNPLLCASYSDVYARAVSDGALEEAAPGVPFTFSGFVGGAAGTGFTVQPISNIDFTRPGAIPFLTPLVREVVAAGHDGWMEDFGEYGKPGPTHNSYPTAYHCAMQRIAREFSAQAGRPLTRFSRSGWTGTAPCVDDVWGGDNETVFGFDGLQSVVREGLTMGLSGISRWGSDIGGYDSFSASEQLNRELLARWIEVGAVSGVMRTKGGGLAFPSYTRPQVWEPPTLPVWARYTKLRVALLPYIEAADATYRATGLPLMRHLSLVAPGDPASVREDDAFGFGPSLVAAPVLTAGARTRALHLPPGRWIDLWRSWTLDPRSGMVHLGRPRTLAGDVTVPAPLDQLPLFARAGTVLALLPAGIDTLSTYGGRSLVHLRDRDGERVIVGWPRGRTVQQFGPAGETVTTDEERRGAPSLRLAIRGRRYRTYQVSLSLAELQRPFSPGHVLVSGGRLVGHPHLDRRTGVYALVVRGLAPTLLIESGRRR